MDVAAWLKDLELERYVSAFRDNDIDANVLPKLTAEDMISIGVTSVGHRRKLLDAIAGLGMAVPTAVAAAPAPGALAEVDAERRQLTVMFCDLVGSTALSTRHDPEDLRELIGNYLRAVAETVGRFDGFVARYMGDGVLIYFGYPRAHEDDAEQAVRAALAVIEAVSRLPAREDLRVRLGVATGLAVVGDLVGKGAAQERGVVGETPNLAARLQEGLEIARTTGEHGWDAEIHRLAGTVLLAENKLTEGEASLQQAIRIAQAQQAKSPELRAVRDLGRLWGEQGRRAEARDLIAPVYGWFTEGFDTADLKEAKVLLDQLV